MLHGVVQQIDHHLADAGVVENCNEFRAPRVLEATSRMRGTCLFQDLFAQGTSGVPR
jgi:hypothetical protein